MTADVKLETSQELKDCFKWRCCSGININTMPMLNQEFNHYRGLFPLKVFVTGPPVSGKTYFANKLSDEYGIPHITVEDMIDMGKNLKNEYGDNIRAKIEELKDAEQENYEKTRKKKDPDFDRETCNPRLPDEMIEDLVKT